MAAEPTSRTIERATPNLLTVARVLLALAFFGVLTPWKYQNSPLARGDWPDWWLVAAAALFVVAALTDALDGYLARRWDAVSVFGRIMDPFADKFLVIGAFIFLAGPGFTYGGEAVMHLPGLPRPSSAEDVSGSVTGVQAWMVCVILGRELLVTSIRAAMESRGVSFAATWSGKWKMILQSVCVPAVLVLLNVPYPHEQPGRHDWAGTTIVFLVWVTVLVTAWSGVPYVVRAVRALRGRGGREDGEFEMEKDRE